MKSLSKHHRHTLTCRKRFLTPRNNQTANIVVILQRSSRMNQILKEVIAQGVEGLRPMEGDEAHSESCSSAGGSVGETSLDENVVVFVF